MVYTQTKAIADARRLIWKYIFHIFCLLSSIHFSDIFLSLKSMEFGEEYFGTEAGAMKLILRYKVWKLGTRVRRNPWMNAGHDGSVHVNAATRVAIAEELVRSNQGCQLQATSRDAYLTLEVSECCQATSFGFCSLTGSGGRILESLGAWHSGLT